MSTYSIAQLEELSGIKAHTIRIWEQRYNLLKPERTGSNIRLYNDDQLRRFLNAVLLLNSGIKISKVAAFTEKEIANLINRKIEEEKSSDFFSEAIVTQLMTSGLQFNEAGFEKAFSSAILKFGIMDSYMKVIYPLLVRVGLLWSNTGLSSSQEHFISNLIKKKLFAAFDSLPIPASAKHKWILFLPEQEFHEIGLLFAAYLLRLSGNDVIYLGQSVPYDSLKDSIDLIKPTHLMFFIVRNYDKKTVQQLVNNMENDFKKHSLILSCNESKLKGLKLGKKFTAISSVNQFHNLIKQSV